MSSLKIKYIMFGGDLHKIEEYTYRGYGGSTHTGSTVSKVPAEHVEAVKKMLEKEGRVILKNEGGG